MTMEREELGRVGLLLREIGGVSFDEEGRIVVSDRRTLEEIRSHFESAGRGRAAAEGNTKCIVVGNGYCPKSSGTSGK